MIFRGAFCCAFLLRGQAVRRMISTTATHIIIVIRCEIHVGAAEAERRKCERNKRGKQECSHLSKFRNLIYFSKNTFNSV